MSKETSRITKDTSKNLIVICLAVVLIILPAAFRPMMLHDSFWIDYVWSSQFTALLREGIWYPRWLPWSHEGLGSPVFYFYPPLAFYIAGAFGLAGLSVYGSIFATFAFSFLVSGIGCYYWLRHRMPHPTFGAVFFVLAPYHCFDFYSRGALAESVAIAFLPLLALGLRRIAEGGTWKYAALAYGAMILSHLPLALLTSCFFITPYVVMHRRCWAQFTCACVAGVCLASIYLIPAVGLEPFRDVSRLWLTPFYRPSFWSVYAANWHFPEVARVHITILVLAIPALIFAIASRSAWALYSLAMLGIAAGLVPGLWSLPLLEDVQFSYRILPLAELGLAAAFASRFSLSAATRVAAMGPPFAWMVVVTQFAIGSQPPPDRKTLEERHLDVSEYLPRGALRTVDQMPWLVNPKRGRLPPPEIGGWTVRPMFYFPAWSCGTMEPKTKLLMHRPDCAPKIKMTPYEKFGTLISLIGLLSVLLVGRMRFART